MSGLQVERLSLAYHPSQPVVRDVSHYFAEGKITGIVGANASGKSTLLRACARLMRPAEGSVVLDGHAIHHVPTREVARRLGLMVQQPHAPEAIRVHDLVRRGRFPHQRFFHASGREDERAVRRALALSEMSVHRDRPVDELSGGQRQRAWIAMVLAQQTDIILFDEPTTYLDLRHRRQILALLNRLNRLEGRTIVAVLHDVNEALELCDEILAMRSGRILAAGDPAAVLSPDVLESTFGVECDRIIGHGSAFLVGTSHAVGTVTADHGSAGAADDIGPRSPVALRSVGVSSGYSGRPVLHEVSLEVPRGAITAIVGPNACGKSTLLRTVAALHPTTSGHIEILGGRLSPPRSRARSVSVLHQEPSVPTGVTVEELVAVGRHPHQRWYARWTAADRRAVSGAMEMANVAELATQPVASLSGGQRRRAFLAMAIAQEAEILLLDEPTTFMDIANQARVLDVVYRLAVGGGRTVVLVLHEIWQAMRYADHIVVMRDGRIVLSGPPEAVAESTAAGEAFGVELHVVTDPLTGKPLLLPAALGAPDEPAPPRDRRRRPAPATKARCSAPQGKEDPYADVGKDTE